MLFQVSLLSDWEVRVDHVEKLSELLLNFINHITPYDVALAYIWEPRETWFCRGLQGEIPNKIDKGDIFTNAIKEMAKPILVPDMKQAGIDPEEIPICCTSMIGLPIYRDTKVIGCLELFRKGANPFNMNDLILTKQLLLSSEKVLTGVLMPDKDFDDVLDVRIDIPQRHILLDVLHQYEELSKRLSFPLSVAIIEIEDRDKFGLYTHIPEGVRTLRTLARRIQDGLRCYDKVLRYEELSFFVILPGCSSRDAVTALHKATLSLGADLADTMTIGVATLPDEAQDAKGVINVAHQALSHAKKKGIHVATFAQTGAMKQVNISLELHMKRLIQAGPSLKSLNELLSLFKIQCQADEVAIRYETPGIKMTWEGQELGYLHQQGLPQDIFEWIITYLAPAWAVAAGLDTDIQNWYIGILNTASIVSDLRAGYPMGFSLKVSDQIFTLAREMGVGDTLASKWANSSLAANIGYLGIPTTLFTKGELTPFDKKKINNHPIITSRILKNVSVLNLDEDLLIFHHENYDGSGYPRGLKGDDIPLSARAMRVVDTYNAMTTPRLYRPQMRHQEALKELCSMSGKVLDPEVTSLYVDLIGS
ncbi:MAG TPA: HD domain-containing phosphohydrolase [Desulfomonilia bacterium]|nr:HD domain-containing phosphohydrolase [Desulfomonilia bacterium]